MLNLPHRAGDGFLHGALTVVVGVLIVALAVGLILAVVLFA